MSEDFNGVEMTTGKSVPQHTVIWLHGLGADGNDFAPIVPELEKLGVSPVRFLFPHAPMRPVTINGGMQMRAWYDITSLDFDQREQDSVGTAESQALVETLITRELDRGIDSRQIYLAGFSQGGAIALHTGLRHANPLAGIIALSTYLPFADRIASETSPVNQDIPVFMAHGSQDDVIALHYAEASRDKLASHGYDVSWHSYPMPHSLSLEEIQDLAAWMRSNGLP